MVARSIAATLATMLTEGTRRALLITTINDEPAARSPLAPYLAEAGFASTGMGYQLRRNFASERSEITGVDSPASPGGKP